MIRKQHQLIAECAQFVEQKWKLTSNLFIYFIDIILDEVILKCPLKPSILKSMRHKSLLDIFEEIFISEFWSLLEVYFFYFLKAFR